MKARVITITSALLLLLAHSTAAIKFSSHKYSVSEVSSFTEEMWKAKFEAFMAKYGKSYATAEEYNKRFNAYKTNFLEAAKSNDRQPYALFGENKMFDNTKEDWSRLTGYSGPMGNKEEVRRRAYSYVDSESIKEKHLKEKREDIPTSFSWCNDTRYCTPPKDQDECGGCWAFAATGAVETLWAIHKGKLYNLSAQYFIDCSKTSPNIGCSGGNSITAFEDIREVPREEDYPFTGTDGECKTGFKTDVRLLGSYELVDKSTSFEELAENIYKNGPLTFTAYSDVEFNSYMEGVLICTETYNNTNHAMLIVGYGIENGMKYIVLRNSWGDWWGEKGYAKLRFGDCASRMYDYARPIVIPDEWTCGVNRKDICDCNCGVYDPDCETFYDYSIGKYGLHPTTCEEGTICSAVTAKCTKWTCDPLKYKGMDYVNRRCDCNCGSWDPDCDNFDTYDKVYGCDKSNKEICSRVDGSCVANWTCGMKAYGVPGKCHCDCGVYDPGCLNCSSELINCTERPMCKKDGGVGISGLINLLFVFVLSLLI